MSEQEFAPKTEMPAGFADTLRGEAKRRSERSDEFWNAQRIRIRARIRAQKAPRSQPVRIALAGAALLFLAVLLTAPAGKMPEKPPEIRPQANVIDADQQLLVAVEHALRSATPEALQPLTLLVESSSNPYEVEGISQKEHDHED